VTASEAVIELSGGHLTLADLEAIAVGRAQVRLDPAALSRVAAAYGRVQEWGRRESPMYGVNTGFGEMVPVTVPARHARELQANLLQGHAAGAGPVFCEDVVRATMLARLTCLLQGYSGVGIPVVELLAEFLNRGIHPVIPQQGSLGASGDLAPLSHMAIAMCGIGSVVVDGETVEAAVALRRRGLQPVTLGFKEGLALINGTSAMTAAA
jgi:histidine ammonia-lyase